MLPVMTNLVVSDMSQSLEFYCQKLGFDVEFGVMEGNISHFDGEMREYQFVSLKKGEWKLMLQTDVSFKDDLPNAQLKEALGGSFTIYFRDADPDELYAVLSDKVTILKPPATPWYGMRELYLADPDGYMLCFAKIDTSATPPA